MLEVLDFTASMVDSPVVDHPTCSGSGKMKDCIDVKVFEAEKYFCHLDTSWLQEWPYSSWVPVTIFVRIESGSRKSLYPNWVRQLQVLVSELRPKLAALHFRVESPKKYVQCYSYHGRYFLQLTQCKLHTFAAIFLEHICRTIPYL